MWKRPQKDIHRFILYHGQDNVETNNSKDWKNIISKSILDQDGGLILRSHRETCGIQHLRLHQLDGKSTTIGRRTKVEILGGPHPGLNSGDFFRFRDAFSLAGDLNSLAIDGRCRQAHLPHATFHMHSHCTEHTARMHVFLGSSLSSVPKIDHSSTRHVSSCASQKYTGHQPKFSLTCLSCVTDVLFSEPRPAVPTVKIHGGMALPRNSTHRQVIWAQKDRAQQDSGQSTKWK